MTRSFRVRCAGLLLAAIPGCTGCTVRGSTGDAAAGAPPPAVVERDGDPRSLRVDHPERFPLATVSSRAATPELRVTGVVGPDVSRNVPVVSLAAGRVVDLRARLGDQVRAGQVLLRIESPDVAGAFSDYRKASADLTLVERQLERAATLFERGAIAEKDVEVARDAAEKARVDADNAAQRLRLLGADPARPPLPFVDIMAPVAGVITEQNVTNAAGVKSLDNSPNLFTISDLSRVWIVCDVPENDLADVHVGDGAEIHLTAYPGRALTGRIGNIGAVLDPAIRTAKVRVEVANAGGLLRIGMFVTAIFHGRTAETRAVVPAAAVLHLHERDWVYVPAGDGRFERREVVGGPMLAGNLQELRAGLRPGERVVANALVFQTTVEQ
jgi:cobalt-zinc-cadmium efflux system membrane fusion protein